MTASPDVHTALCSTTDPLFGDLLADWRELWRSDNTREPFSSPDWLLPYLQTFEPAVQPVFLHARVAGVLAAIMPLVREATMLDGMPGRAWRAPMNDDFFYRVGVLCRHGYETAVASAFIDLLGASPGWDVVSIPRFAVGTLPSLMARIAAERGFPTLIRPDRQTRLVELPGSGATAEQPWLAQVTPGLRKNMRRTQRQLREHLGADLVLERHEVATPEQLDRFYAIEASGWKGRENTAIRSAPATLRFFNQLAEHFVRERAFILHFLRAGAVTLAGGFSLIGGSCLYTLKWGYDESYARYGPGRLLTGAMARDSWERGIRSLDLGSDADYKREWTPHTRDHASVYIFNRSLYGRLLFAYRGLLGQGLARLITRMAFRGESGRPV